MNGRIESIGWQIKPDQMQTIYPFLSLIVLVSFKPIVYPLIAKFGIRTPLQKLILSNMFAVFAFMCTTLLQYVIFVSVYRRAVFPGSRIVAGISILFMPTIYVVLRFRAISR